MIDKLEGVPGPGSLEKPRAGCHRKALFECGGPATVHVNNSLGRLQTTRVTRSALTGDSTYMKKDTAHSQHGSYSVHRTQIMLITYTSSKM